MSRKTRARRVFWLTLLSGLIFVGIGIFLLVTPSHFSYSVAREFNPAYTGFPHQPFEDISYWSIIGIGIFMMAISPLAVRAANKATYKANKQAEMDEMLEDYRRHKKNNRI